MVVPADPFVAAIMQALGVVGAGRHPEDRQIPVTAEALLTESAQLTGRCGRKALAVVATLPSVRTDAARQPRATGSWAALAAFTGGGTGDALASLIAEEVVLGATLPAAEVREVVRRSAFEPLAVHEDTSPCHAAPVAVAFAAAQVFTLLPRRRAAFQRAARAGGRGIGRHIARGRAGGIPRRGRIVRGGGGNILARKRVRVYHALPLGLAACDGDRGEYHEQDQAVEDRAIHRFGPSLWAKGLPQVTLGPDAVRASRPG